MAARAGSPPPRMSRLCLGMMSYGDPAWAPWVVGLDTARALFRQGLENGIECFDTANYYSDGESERILGRLVREHGGRHRLTLATKVGLPVADGRGLSAAQIARQAEASLRRLDTDYIDLYQVHSWDETVPIEETLGALEALVDAGKIRAYGCSNLDHSQIAQAARAASLLGARGYASAQLQLNLLYQEELRATLPACAEHGLDILAYSPLARGYLADAAAGDAEAAARLSTDAKGQRLYGGPRGARVRAEQLRIAAELGAEPAAVALAWVLAQPGVRSVIVGASRSSHLDAALRGRDLRLPTQALDRLAAAYEPRDYLRVRLNP
ncbi:aldo/keto reductase [Pigmentiphaga sp. H8]|uniref:aldo/keto reductase n=1 Tax=Pigmentiphaga sp. H8 TaxID=2488560 RepID=UPI000F59E338|nr:aldo/keto reductase [Pigmentiphaga sp. H8]AZG07018.1 aldo/keto reductase [Pigmentiphaga sp. H8]